MLMWSLSKHKKAEKLKELQEEIRKKIDDKNKLIVYNTLFKPFVLKLSYNSIIPLQLYTCWHTKNLPPLMKENFNFLVESNTKITFHLYDENECREFIKTNFEPDVLCAYDALIPCSYKSDLWRYCVLFINGGIYMDIKYKCVNGFKFISLTEQEYFVRDRPEKCVYTALIVALPRNEVLFKCIRQIVANVKNRYYGFDSLEPTGPRLLGKYFTSEDRENLELYFKDTYVEDKLDKFYIVKKDRIILTYYDGYREEQAKYQKNKYYAVLWKEKNIYK